MSACTYADNNQHIRSPLPQSSASLPGLGSSEPSKAFLPPQAANHSDQQAIPLTMADDDPFTTTPAEQQAKRDYESLPSSKKELLARSIVMAADWDKLYHEFNAAMDDYAAARQAGLSGAKMNSYSKRSDLADSWTIVEENPYIRSALLNLRREKDLAHLIGEARQDKCPLFDYLDIFEIVIDHYIALYPADKRGWDFLWFMMIMEEDEIPQFRIIKELLRRKGLTRFPYGKKIYDMVKDYGYVEAIPSGRQPLERISEGNDSLSASRERSHLESANKATDAIQKSA